MSVKDTQYYYITGMDCADCAKKLETGLGRLAGVQQCQVNFMTTKMAIEATLPPEQLVGHIQALGYDVAQPDQTMGPTSPSQQLRTLLFQPRNILTLIGIFLIGGAFLNQWFMWLPSLTVPLFFLGGVCGLYFPAKSGLAAMRYRQGLDINVLMCLATIGAFAIGEYAEAATVIVLFSLGEALEGYTTERARESIRSLTQLVPAEATVLRFCIDCQGCRGRDLPDGSGIYESGPCPWCGQHEQRVAVETLAVGDQILVKPDERIPMDGRVLEGQSSVNQAPITGESLPIEKNTNDQVFAGTVNGEGTLTIEVTHLATDNTLARLIHLVEEAQSQKTQTQRFVDKFAQIYTPAVVAGAGLVAILPPLLWGQPFWDTATESGWLYRALTLLVIACPCALVIATPVSVVSAISAAARRGVLIKGGAYLEALGQIKIIAFDKTGTLTQGQPELTDISCFDQCCTQARQLDPLTRCDHCDDMLTVAAAVERYSTHPLAQAVITAAEARTLPVLEAHAVKTRPGQGVQGQVAQKSIFVGSHSILHGDTCSPPLCEAIDQAETQGKTTMLVKQEEQVLGYLAVSDQPRPGSALIFKALKTMGIQKTVMLTGDNATVAQTVGHTLGVDSIQAGLMPEDKVQIVQELIQKFGPRVAMVGDGVNDAPALAAANLGIAMGGSGTPQALETADVALMADDLSQLPTAIRLGQRTTTIIRFNIWFSLLIKAIFLVAALLGGATLWMAIVADVGASLLVTLNGMRLLRPMTIKVEE